MYNSVQSTQFNRDDRNTVLVIFTSASFPAVLSIKYYIVQSLNLSVSPVLLTQQQNIVENSNLSQFAWRISGT